MSTETEPKPSSAFAALGAVAFGAGGALALIACLAGLEPERLGWPALVGVLGALCALWSAYRLGERGAPQLDATSRLLVFVVAPLALVDGFAVFVLGGVPEWVGWTVLLGAALLAAVAVVRRSLREQRA